MTSACANPSPKSCERQAQAGIDVVDDGEFGKSTSWSLYALKRLSGFEQRPVKPGANPLRGARIANDSGNFTKIWKNPASGPGPT